MISGAVIAAVIGMIGWGVSNAAVKDVVARFGPIRAVIFRNIVACTALGLALLYMPANAGFTLNDMFFGLGLAVLGYIPFALYLKALETAKVGIVVPVARGHIVVSALIAFTFLGEPFTSEKLVALSVILAGAVLSAVDLGGRRVPNGPSINRAIQYTIGAALLWGVVFSLFTYPSQTLGPIFFAFIIEGVVLLSAIVHLRMKGERLFDAQNRWPDVRTNWLHVIFTGIGAGLGTSFVSIAYTLGDVSIVSAISGASVVVSVAFAAVAFGERLRPLQYFGVFLVTVGIVLAALV